MDATARPPVKMKAMVLTQTVNLAENRSPLELTYVPVPVPAANEILVRVSACGVCRTDLDVIEGRIRPAAYPVIPGHQIIGHVVERGSSARRFDNGDRVGIAWIHSTCGTCRFCLSSRENLCNDFHATGRDAPGGFAEYTAVREDFAYEIPPGFSDAEAAPLLCAGSIGYRSLRLAEVQDGDSIGLSGFGGSAHLVLKLIKHLYPGSRVFVFSRTGSELAFARELGADWTGAIDEDAPERLNAVIDTTPAWKPLVHAMKNLEKSGRLVINAISKEGGDKEALLAFDFSRDLWMEKEIKSVANITRADVEAFLRIAADMRLRPELQEYPLEGVNTALLQLKDRKIRGVKVISLR